MVLWRAADLSKILAADAAIAKGDEMREHLSFPVFTNDKQGNYHLVKPPKPSRWVCCLTGTDTTRHFYLLSRPLGQEPNWFWRKMQHLLLGLKWVKE